MREIAVIISDLYLPRAADAPSATVLASLPGLAEAARFGQRSTVDDGSPGGSGAMISPEPRRRR
jgi:hypothetical protein